MNTKNAELLAGIFVLIGLAVMGGLILNFGKLRSALDDQYELTVVFQNASGLIEGSEVRMGGARVGLVTDKPRLSDEVNAEVKIAIDGKIKLPEGSIFEVTPASFLGDMRIDITTPAIPHEVFIAPGSIVVGEPPSDLSTIADTASEIVEDTNALIKKLNMSLDSVDEILLNIESITSKVDQEILTTDNVNKVTNTLDEISILSKTSYEFIEDLKPVVERLEVTITSTGQTVDSLDKQINEIGPEAKQAIQSVNQLLSTLADFENRPGLLNAIINDSELKGDAKLFLENLRKHGIIRYKDTEGEEVDQSRAFSRQP